MPAVVRLLSQDEQLFTVPVAEANMSQTLKNLIIDLDIEENQEDETPVPIPNVHSHELRTILDYVHAHAPGTTMTEEELRLFDSSLMQRPVPEIERILHGVNFLDIKGLLDLGCRTLGQMLIGKTPEQIREMFNITSDYTPEEIATIRQENGWVAQAV